jgi:hypothetical protein
LQNRCPKELLTQFEIYSGRDSLGEIPLLRGNLMNASTSPSEAAAEYSLSSDEEEIAKPIEQRALKPLTHIEADADKIRASVVRLTAHSIDGLEGLSSELQQLQTFLKSEVERVQGEIESALAGIKIIIETVAPWKKQARLVRAGPAANIESTHLRR